MSGSNGYEALDAFKRITSPKLRLSSLKKETFARHVRIRTALLKQSTNRIGRLARAIN